MSEYPMHGPHVALAGGGRALRRAAAEAAAAAGAPLLVGGPDDGPGWAWLATEDAAGVKAAAARGRPPGDDGPLGLAGPLPGPAGFAAAHRRAVIAAAAATLAGRTGVVALEDVTLEALVAGDAEDAREVVRAELGRLAAPGPATARLRMTLETALTSGAGRDAVAARLGVAPRTVSYRLARAEQLLGHAVAPRRPELAAALRLHRALGGHGG